MRSSTQLERFTARLVFAVAASASGLTVSFCQANSGTLSDQDAGTPSSSGGGDGSGGTAGRGSADGGSSNSEAGAAGAEGCSYIAPITQTLPQRSTQLDESYAYYPRVIRLEHSGAKNGTLVATVVRKSAVGHWIGHIIQSLDGGLTFSSLSEVDDTVAAVDGNNMCCQTLYELPSKIGALPAGTLLWAASIGADYEPSEDRRMTERVWQSPDGGKTWSFLSTVTTATTSAGTWEPEFTVCADGHLVIFYSDETDPAYSQKLVEWRSVDGLKWTDFRSVVAAGATLRPGMANVRKTPSGNWLMSYEVCSTDHSHECDVHVRSSTDGWTWGDPTDIGEKVALADGEWPGSSPTLTVAGNTVLLKAMRQRNADQTLSFAPNDGKAIFANANNGRGSWFSIQAPVTMTDAGQGGPGYSNPLLGSADGKAVFDLAIDFGTDGTLHAYFASGPVSPLGASAAEGAQALIVNGKTHFLARSAAGTLEQWLTGGPGAAFGTSGASTTKLVGAPASLLYKTQQHVFARSSAGALVHSYIDTTTSTGANDTWGTGIASDPAVLIAGDAQHAWATDGAGALQHWWWTADQGMQHETWADGVMGRPAAVLDNDTLHVFTRSTSGGLIHVWSNTDQGSQSETIGSAATAASCSTFPPLASNPVAAIIGGAQHVWAVDETGSLQHFWWNPGQPWRYETWGEGVAGRPTLMQVGDAEHIFVRGADGAVQHWWWSAAQGLKHDTWSDAGAISGDPVALLNGATQEVFALDLKGNLQHWSWTSASGMVHDTWGQ